LKLLPDILFKGNYKTSTNFLNLALKPALQKEIKAFSALSAYFSVDSLILLSEELDKFFNKNGTLKIVVGIQQPDQQLLEATKVNLSQKSIDDFKKKMFEEASLLQDEFKKSKLAVLAFLMKEGKLEVKIAQYVHGDFHPKIYIIEDVENNVVVVEGSGNFTTRGLSRNFEKFSLFTSWGKDKHRVYPKDGSESSIELFQNIWEGKEEGLLIEKLDESFAVKLLEVIGINEKSEAENTLNLFKNSLLNRFKNFLKSSPIYAQFNLGTSALFPHQINSVQKALSMWPIRILFSDEVGLGKTLELGTLIAYLYKHNLVKNVLVLCPAQLINQWQDEMNDHFDLNFKIYDRNIKKWISNSEIDKPQDQAQPIRYSESFPELAIISKSMIGNEKENIFTNVEVLPDLLVVDEAHHARGHLRKDRTFHTTIFRKVLKQVVPKLNHIAFASATPIRKNIDEYYYLLELLGINSLMSPQEYDECLYIFDNYFRKEELQLDQQYFIAKMVRNLVSKGTKDILCSNEEQQKIYDEIKENPEIIDDNDWLFLNLENLIRISVLKNPTRLLTARNVQENLKKYPETYKIPERDLRQTPITNKDVSEDLEFFYDQLINYIDTYYEMTQSELTKKRVNLAFRKSGMKERFVSSFWSARESIKNRLKRLDEILLMSEQKKLNLEFFQEEDFEFEDEYQEQEYEDSKKINWERVIDYASIEKEFLNNLLEYAENKIINEVTDGKDPDPKINAIIKLLGEHFKKNTDFSVNEPILIFSKYTDTLNKVTESVLSYFESEYGSLPGYANYRGDKRTIRLSGQRNDYPTTKKRITQSLKDRKIQIVFCSSAANEGLNLQAASVMINVDVPWVPSELEQRIGRIARLGQKKPIVTIHNLWYPNGIEAEIYRRLILRQKDMWFAIGTFPEQIGEEIRNAVDNQSDFQFDKTLERLNELKDSAEMSVLRNLWSTETLQREPWGNIFRLELFELIKKLRINHNEIETEAGESGVITFSSPEFDALFSSSIVEKDFSTQLFGIMNSEELWGLCYIDKTSNSVHLIDPMDLPKVLNSLLTGAKLNITTNLIDEEITLERLLTFYKNTDRPTLIPKHFQFNLLNHEANLPYDINTNLELTFIGTVNV
jgi:superfamily II DNA or RNA helicase